VIRHGEKPNHTNWRFDNSQLPRVIGLCVGLLHELRGQLGCSTLVDLVNLVKSEGWYPQETCELAYDTCMLYGFIEKYLKTETQVGEINIQPPSCPSALLHWETLAIVFSHLPGGLTSAGKLRGHRTITDDKGNIVSLEEVTQKVLFPVQLFVDPHFHQDRTFKAFRVTSWKELEAESGKFLPVRDSAGVSFVLQWAVTNSIDPKQWAQQQEHSKVYETIGVHPKKADTKFNLVALDFSLRRRVAVGECGLDYTRPSIMGMQRQVFVTQIELARAQQKRMVLHLRAASDDLAESKQVYLEAGVLLQKGGLHKMHFMHFHCFLGDSAFVTLWLVEYPNTIFGITHRLLDLPHGYDTVRTLKLQQMVLESDAPHLGGPALSKAPGHSPFFLPYLATRVGLVRNIPSKSVLEASRRVASDFYGIPI
jgi:Tat protein secretion system quality control protein TatD with DNase activity